MKKLMLICAPVTSRSGYGAHARDLTQSFLQHDKYDIHIIDVPWGDCPRNALDKNNLYDKLRFLSPCYRVSDFIVDAERGLLSNHRTLTDNYINAGVVFFTKKHKHFFDAMLEFYFEHKEELDNWSIPNTGREQTIFNFMLEKHNIKKKYLPLPWNMFGMHRKDMFFHNNVLEDKTPYFLKYGYIWHFTGFPIEDRIRIMGQAWEAFGGNYELECSFYDSHCR